LKLFVTSRDWWVFHGGSFRGSRSRFAGVNFAVEMVQTTMALFPTYFGLALFTRPDLVQQANNSDDDKVSRFVLIPPVNCFGQMKIVDSIGRL
jgi:hypothetical protein